MTNIRVGQPARVAVDAFPDLKLTGHVDSLVAGDRQHLRAASARQRDRELHQSGAARPGEDRARQQPFAWSPGAARHVGRATIDTGAGPVQGGGRGDKRRAPPP